MFSYKLNDFYNVADYDSDYVRHYLEAIGINKLESFLQRPQEEDELNPFLLKNMDIAIKVVKRAIEQNKEMYLVVDSDPDGYTSGAIFYNYIKTIAPQINIIYSLHTGKEHGIELDRVPSSAEMIIIPDAGSSQRDELLALANQGKDILVLDHHESDIVIENEHVIIVNNQLSPEFPNKALSGSGVTFKFVEAYDTTYMDGSRWKIYYDVAALGVISDMMYSGTLDNNYIITKGLQYIKNPLIQALLNKQSYSITSPTNPTKIDIAFYITPVMNGVIRIGSMQEKDNLFIALADYNINKTIETEYRGKQRVEDFYTFVARESVNIKSRQDTIVKKTTEKIFSYIEEHHLQDNQIIIYKTSLTNPDEVPAVITGLTAMKVCAKYNKPSMIIRPQLIDGVQYYSGSIRGRKAEGFPSFREFLLESGLVEYAAGHAFAAGTSVKEDNIPLLIEYANEKLKDVDFGSEVIEVSGVNPCDAALFDFASHGYLYGNGIPTPVFAFTLFLTPRDYTVMGTRKDTIKFSMDGITFIKFHATELIEKIHSIDTGVIQAVIIGRPQINEFRGVQNLQVVIDNIEVEPYVLL